jgi:tetratricopeptide (TPR) repeat protein
MLYLIIPPVIIIASLGLFILFISRRAGDLSRFDRLKIKSGADSGKFGKRRKIFSLASVGSFFLNFLEKTTQSLKVIFLRFHNRLNRLVLAIKEKKKKNGMDLPRNISEPSKEIGPAERPAEKQNDFIQKIFIKKDETEPLPMMSIDKENKEEEIRPIISRTITHPESYGGAKNKLEEILIERIASDPRDIEAYERLGDYYLEQENHEDARECYKQVLKLSPMNYKVRIKMKKLKGILGR